MQSELVILHALLCAGASPTEKTIDDAIHLAKLLEAKLPAPPKPAPRTKKR